MSGRRLSANDIASAKHEEEIFNSMLKRGEIRSPDKITKTMHVVCGCGNEGCIFLCHIRNESEEERNASIAEYDKKMGYQNV